MKKILLISYLFAPQNVIGALRPTKLADLLGKMNHTIDVVTAGYKNNCSLPVPYGLNRIYMMYPEKPEQQDKSVDSSIYKTRRKSSIPKPIKQIYRSALARKREKQFVRFFKKLYESELINNNYDVVISSFGPLASIECGLYLKKKKPDIVWISDFRDPVITDITPWLFRPIWKHKESMACRKADYIMAVSHGYLKRICGDNYRDKARMIPNGYDYTDLLGKDDYRINQEAIHITYVGSMYEGRRKITPLFKCLRELSDEGKIHLEKIHFNYGGGDFDTLYAQAKLFDIEHILINHGIIPRNECLKLQFSSHLLILATWNDRGEEGVFPGKFLEYMLIGRPIISITGGDIPNGEATAVMREGNFGVAYEEANHIEDYKNLKEYVEATYREWEEKGEITFSPVSEVRERYNYKHIIEQIEALLNGEK